MDLEVHGELRSGMARTAEDVDSHGVDKTGIGTAVYDMAQRDKAEELHSNDKDLKRMDTSWREQDMET